MKTKISVEPDAWATKDVCVGPTLGRIRYDKLPIQSLNPLQYTHEKLYSEKTVIGLMKAAYYEGYTDREEELRATPNGVERRVMPYLQRRKEIKMFEAIGSLTKAIVGVVVETPLAIAADIVTLGGTLTDKNQCGGETYTETALRGVMKNVEHATKPD